MRYSEVSARYAKSIYDLAQESGSRQQVFEELQALRSAFHKDATIKDYIYSDFVTADLKEKALNASLDSKTTDLVKNFVLLLARRGRLQLIDEIIDAFQATSDEAHGVTRGTVKAASALSEDQQRAIEEKIADVTGKKVILNYELDPSVIGGLIAEVGGYVFDDTVITHLRRLKDDLKRRAH
tara:strand:+ start:139736 stop:140281 length:546 start_codon:yes stop_codon:yes gene_type:complete